MCSRNALRLGVALAFALVLPATGCQSSGANGSGGADGLPSDAAGDVNSPSASSGGHAGSATDAATEVSPPADANPSVDLSSADVSPPEAGGAGGATPPSDGGTPTQGGQGGQQHQGGGGGEGGSPRMSMGGAPGGTGGAGTGGATGGGVAATGGAGAGGAPGGDYACTLMIGIQATWEWWEVGFENMVDNAKWELIWVHSGFVELWADPADPVWSTAVTSPCAQNPGKPDRVIFLALNFDYTTAAEWDPVVISAVNNIKTKYPSARRIELMSFIRAPGDNACPQAPAKRSAITPAQDDAMAMAAAANPGLVFVAPKFEAKTCSEFNSNPPHPSPAGATAWATMMANYYR